MLFFMAPSHNLGFHSLIQLYHAIFFLGAGLTKLTEGLLEDLTSLYFKPYSDLKEQKRIDQTPVRALTAECNCITVCGLVGEENGFISLFTGKHLIILLLSSSHVCVCCLT